MNTTADTTATSESGSGRSVVVIGGHGKVALLAEPLLVEAGHRVEAVIRDAQQSGDVEATGARAVVTDIQQLDEAGWDELLRGRDTVVWSAGAGGGDPERTWAVDRDAAIASIDAARRVGVRQYVMVSYFGAGPDHGVPEEDSFYAYAESKAQADEHLQKSAGDLDVVILRPSALTLDDTDGQIDASADEAASVSRRTVARVIAEAVGRDDLHRAVVAFNDGHEPIGKALDRAAGQA